MSSCMIYHLCMISIRYNFNCNLYFHLSQNADIGGCELSTQTPTATITSPYESSLVQMPLVTSNEIQASVLGIIFNEWLFINILTKLVFNRRSMLIYVLFNVFRRYLQI